MAKKINSIVVQGITINIETFNKEDYICLTDMVPAKGDNSRAADVIKNWLRNRTTIEFLGTWESIYNPNFKVVEFDHFKKEAGLPTFTLSVSSWVESTNSIGIFSKQGRYGGTYAHKDIAFEFGSAISPVFKLHIYREYQRLKEIESNEHKLNWDTKRMLSKTNYYLHTEAIKNHVIPISTLSKKNEWIEYAKEADILNLALFGCTAKEWRSANKELARSGKNIRDFASINELVVMSNLESVNSIMIESKTEKKVRYQNLKAIAQSQLKVLNDNSQIGTIKKLNDGVYVDGEKK